jgi:hypothetical protein
MKRLVPLAAACVLLAAASAANAGKIYLTGHDPDFHAQGQVDGQVQLNVALNYVTGGTYNDGSTKFLWVESDLAATSGHRVGFDGLSFIGVGAGNVDRVDATGFSTVDLSDYSAIVVASSFGGMLTSAEINAMIARSADIASFINSGHGLAAFAECFQTAACDGSNVPPASTTPFGYLPITVDSVDTFAPYHVTAFGALLGLSDDIVSDCCTHNSFGKIGGLGIVDLDSQGTPTTLAGDVHVGPKGLSAPEPSTWAMMLLGFGGLGAMLRRRARRALA